MPYMILLVVCCCYIFDHFQIIEEKTERNGRGSQKSKISVMHVYHLKNMHDKVGICIKSYHKKYIICLWKL